MLLLRNERVVHVLNSLAFGLSYLFLIIELVLVSHHFCLQTGFLSIEGLAYRIGVLAVCCLELGRLVKSPLALVSLMSDQVEELFFAHLREHLSDCLFCTRQKILALGFGRRINVAENSKLFNR